MRDAICVWLKQNGVDPETVPINTYATVVAGWLTIGCFRRRFDGVLDSSRLSPVTVKLRSPPPAAVAGWIAVHWVSPPRNVTGV
jgi:hypothetical protein